MRTKKRSEEGISNVKMTKEERDFLFRARRSGAAHKNKKKYSKKDRSLNKIL